MNHINNHMKNLLEFYSDLRVGFVSRLPDNRVIYAQALIILSQMIHLVNPISKDELLQRWLKLYEEVEVWYEIVELNYYQPTDLLVGFLETLIRWCNEYEVYEISGNYHYILTNVKRVKKQVEQRYEEETD